MPQLTQMGSFRKHTSSDALHCQKHHSNTSHQVAIARLTCSTETAKPNKTESNNTKNTVIYAHTKTS